MTNQLKAIDLFSPQIGLSIDVTIISKLLVLVRANACAGLFVLTLVVAVCGCRPLEVNDLNDRLQPSNFRDWTKQFSELPFANISPDGLVELRNIRNNAYLTENDFIANYYDRRFAITDIQSVDFIVVPFKGMEFMAHTMISFVLKDRTYICVSAEIRTEKGESYSPLLGMSRQYEITYVVADERDVIRLRTRHRDADVYIYPTVATPEQSQALFLDVMQRVNQLAQQPEFYDTIRNNCTTNIVNHVNQLRQQQIVYDWRVLLPGFSDEYAYELGLLDQSVPFDQLKQSAWINDLADRYYDDPQFSRKIRRRRSAAGRVAL